MRPLYDDDGPDGPLPPRREQLPLPRRTEQTHLEPQLREPGGAGVGTPFAAFGADRPDADRPDGVEPSTPTGERAATFREATRRAADDRRPEDRPPDDQLPNGPASR